MRFTIFIFSNPSNSLIRELKNFTKEECIRKCSYALSFNSLKELEEAFNNQDIILDSDFDYIRIIEEK